MLVVVQAVDGGDVQTSRSKSSQGSRISGLSGGAAYKSQSQGGPGPLPPRRQQQQNTNSSVTAAKFQKLVNI